MKKYFALRLVLVVLMSLLISISVYYLVTLAMVMKWSGPMPMKDYLEIAWRNAEFGLEQVFQYQNFGIRPNGESKLIYVTSRIPVSLQINFYAMMVYIPLGLILGVLTAMFSNTWFDNFVSSFVLVFSSVPTYITVFFMIMVFGFGIHLLPQLFMWGGPVDRFVIPVFCIMLYPLAQIIRVVRSEILEGLESNQVLLLKAKGLNRRQIIFRHLFRESLVTVIPQVSELFLFALLMSFIVEKTYQVPGVAKLFIDVIINGTSDGNVIFIDPMEVSLITMFYVLLILTVNLLIDSSRSLLDPRIAKK